MKTENKFLSIMLLSIALGLFFINLPNWVFDFIPPALIVMLWFVITFTLLIVI